MLPEDFDDLLAPPLTEKGCAMLKTGDRGLVDAVIAFGKEIPDDELADKGRGEDVHVTVLYGFSQEDPDMAEVLGNVAVGVLGGEPATATLGKVDHFENDGQDVVKVPVVSDDLERLNAEYCRIFPHENDYPDFEAHLTVAYVKKGEASKYDGDDRFDGMEVSFDTLVFTNTERERTEVDLTAF